MTTFWSWASSVHGHGEGRFWIGLKWGTSVAVVILNEYADAYVNVIVNAGVGRGVNSWLTLIR